MKILKESDNKSFAIVKVQPLDSINSVVYKVHVIVNETESNQYFDVWCDAEVTPKAQVDEIMRNCVDYKPKTTDMEPSELLIKSQMLVSEIISILK